MAKFSYPGKYLSTNLINECIKAVDKNDSQLIIVFSSEVENVDILFIAYLILLKKGRPDIQISLWLQNNMKNGSIYVLHQYIRQAEVAAGIASMADIYYGNETVPYTKDDIVSSDKYMPCLFFEQFDMKSRIFSDSPLWVGKTNVAYQNDRKKLYDAIKAEIKTRIAPENGLDIIRELSFNEVLENLKITTLYHQPPKNNIAHAGKLSTEKSTKYYNRIRNIFGSSNKNSNDLNLGSMMELLIFSLLSAGILKDENESPTDNDEVAMEGTTEAEIAQEKAERRVKTTKNLWHFTKEFVRGINELAQNIIEHTTSKRGVITGRLYRKESVEEFYGQMNKSIQDYFLKYKDDGITHYLIVNIIDDNDIGVIEDLKTKEKSKLSIGEEDIPDLEFQDMLLSTPSKLTPYQIKKSVAHFGLLIFSNLVRVNNGMIIASTNGERETGRQTIVVYNDSVIKVPNQYAPCIGTNYSVIIPIKPFEEKETYDYNLQVKEQITTEELRRIESLLKYKVYDLNLQSAPITDGKSYDRFSVFNLSGITLPNDVDQKEDKLWQSVRHIIPSASVIGKDRFVCIDFERIKFNESQLFRFMGKWEETYSGRPLIIYNIETSLYLKLVNLLKLVIGVSPEFWGRNSLFLFYNYITIDPASRFYYTDIIWGSTFNDFKSVNQILYRFSYNATTLCMDNTKEPCKLPGLTDIAHMNIIEDGSPRPFDLLLKTAGNMTVFEQNAFTLLSNELIKGI